MRRYYTPADCYSRRWPLTRHDFNVARDDFIGACGGHNVVNVNYREWDDINWLCKVMQVSFDSAGWTGR